MTKDSYTSFTTIGKPARGPRRNTQRSSNDSSVKSPSGSKLVGWTLLSQSSRQLVYAVSGEVVDRITFRDLTAKLEYATIGRGPYAGMVIARFKFEGQA
jgi:hypothetical protein